MSIINCLVFEKNFCILQKKNSDFFFDESFFHVEGDINILREYKYSRLINYNSTIGMAERNEDCENLNLLTSNLIPINFSYNQQLLENCIKNINSSYELNTFLTTPLNDLNTTRRKRRKFTSEEERRVARVLKNRRTAEESRQRRIQRMQTLENFVSISEEREKKFKEEIHLIGIQSAFRIVELILIRKKLGTEH